MSSDCRPLRDEAIGVEWEADMEDERDNATNDASLPDGFLTIRLDQLLVILAMTIVLTWQVASTTQYALYILGPLVVIFVVSSFVARRGVRRFVREHGTVSITTTFSPDTTGPKKSILFREMACIIDDAIDRVVDGEK